MISRIGYAEIKKKIRIFKKNNRIHRRYNTRNLRITSTNRNTRTHKKKEAIKIGNIQEELEDLDTKEKIEQEVDRQVNSQRKNYIDHFIFKPLVCQSINYVSQLIVERGGAKVENQRLQELQAVIQEQIEKTITHRKKDLQNMANIALIMADRDDTYRILIERIETAHMRKKLNNILDKLAEEKTLSAGNYKLIRAHMEAEFPYETLDKTKTN